MTQQKGTCQLGQAVNFDIPEAHPALPASWNAVLVWGFSFPILVTVVAEERPGNISGEARVTLILHHGTKTYTCQTTPQSHGGDGWGRPALFTQVRPAFTGRCIAAGLQEPTVLQQKADSPFHRPAVNRLSCVSGGTEATPGKAAVSNTGIGLISSQTLPLTQKDLGQPFFRCWNSGMWQQLSIRPGDVEAQLR